MLLLCFLLITTFVGATTGSIGNSRMVLRINPGETIEKFVLVKNVNNVAVTIDLFATGDLAASTIIKDTHFTLQPGEQKNAYFTIRAPNEGTTETRVNVQFKPTKGASVGLSSTVVVIAKANTNSDNNNNNQHNNTNNNQNNNNTNTNNNQNNTYNQQNNTNNNNTNTNNNQNNNQQQNNNNQNTNNYQNPYYDASSSTSSSSYHSSSSSGSSSSSATVTQKLDLHTTPTLSEDQQTQSSEPQVLKLTGKVTASKTSGSGIPVFISISFLVLLAALLGVLYYTAHAPSTHVPKKRLKEGYAP